METETRLSYQTTDSLIIGFLASFFLIEISSVFGVCAFSLHTFIQCSNELLGRIGLILKYFILAGTESLAPHFSRCDNAVLMLPTSKFRSLLQVKFQKRKV